MLEFRFTENCMALGPAKEEISIQYLYYSKTNTFLIG